MIIAFEPHLTEQIIALIVGIQRGEFGVDITAAEQPDLADIQGFYQVHNGNFWAALEGERVIGTISLLDIGGGQGALRKMFVHRDFRGAPLGVAKGLLDTLLAWAQAKSFREVFLGTTPKYLAAHRFYEKNGFIEITTSDLPAAFPIMSVDKKFYRRPIEVPSS